MINTVYRKKNIGILASTRFGKSLLYQLIFLKSEKAIVLMVLPIITL